jgi:hypothetical protein
MIPGTALTAAADFGRSWWKAAAGFVAAAPLFFLLGQCDGRSTGEIKANGEHAAASIEAIQVDSAAQDLADVERQAEQTRIQQQSEGLTNAVRAAPSGAPAAPSVALNCQRLQQAGRSETSLPVQCRSDGGAKAAAD